jgi:hypothetical protein
VKQSIASAACRQIIYSPVYDGVSVNNGGTESYSSKVAARIGWTRFILRTVLCNEVVNKVSEVSK